jgi:benzoate-CoA ligase family protein
VTQESWAARSAGAADRFQNVPTHRDDACLWLFSGGTTGRPKAVVQTHRSYANTTELYAKGALGYRESDLTLSVPKLFFGYATGSNLFFPFSVGAAAVLFPEHPTPEVLFEQVRRHRPTILVNVPTMVSQMVAHPEASKQDLSCLRFATSAGEALPPELYRRFKETFGVELLDGLGTAEMWHIFITNRPGEVKPGTLGRVVPGFEVRVCDDQGAEVPDGEVGALWVRGASRALGYWQQAERTAAAFRGEWYVTGDLVSRDAEGYFTYAGRSDDMLKVAGKWVAPAEVEDCLLKHEAVAECAVVGVPDAHGLVKPCAFVVRRTAAGEAGAGPVVTAEDLQAFVKERLAPYKYPREVVFVGALPRTHLGKVDRGRLRREAPG